MKRALLALVLALAAVPALAQTTPGSMGGGQVGTGAVEPQGNSGASGIGSASASTAVTGTPVTAATPGSTSNSIAAGSASGPPAGAGSSSSGSSGGGGHGGGIEALCLSASGSVSSVDPDEFGLDCSQ